MTLTYSPFCPIASPTLIAQRIERGAFRLDEYGVLEKRCPDCGEFWPADTEFFQPGGRNSLSAYCKACRVERYRDKPKVGGAAWRRMKREQAAATA